jgi:hypothetical protein
VADYIQGFLQSGQAGVEARNDVTVAIRSWYANRNPFYTRMPHKPPVDRVDYQMYGHPYRARSTTLTNAISSTTTTGLVLGDASFLMNHDVLELVDSLSGATERVQINGDPTSSLNVTVLRGMSATTATGTVTAASTVRLIGNSRTGAEMQQTGLTTKGTVRTNYCQNFMFPVQVGGSAQTTRAMVFPNGISSPFGFQQTMQLQNCVDDIETTLYYGIAEAPVDGTTTAKTNGLKSILQTNKVTAPTNASAYGSTDFIRDLLVSARKGGGQPDVVFVSTEFMAGLATWGQAVQRLDAGSDMFGTPIRTMRVPFLLDVDFVEAPLLLPYTAFALTSSEVYIRPKRPMFWNPHGIRGDGIEGDWICELGLEVVNESHHAWLEGITAFSAN